MPILASKMSRIGRLPQCLMLCAAYTLAQVSLPLQTLTAQVAGEAGSNRVLDGQVQATNAYVEVTAERLRRASLAEADRILRDPALQHAPSVEALVLAVFARHKREELEYLLIRVMDLFVLDRNGVPRAELLEPNAYVFERLAERYYSFVDPSLRYRVLLLTAERDSHAARKMVQHGFARVLTRLNEGGTSLTPAELQEALVMCQVAARFPHPATALGAALVAEKARIPELVQAARNAARVTRTPAGEVNE